MILHLKHSITDTIVQSYFDKLKRLDSSFSYQVQTSQQIQLLNSTMYQHLFSIFDQNVIQQITSSKEERLFTSYQFHPNASSIRVSKNLSIGKHQNFLFIAGPCAIENKQMILEISQSLKQIGAHMIRGGAYKPRTSPYAFQGLQDKGLYHLHEVRSKIEIPVISELMSVNDLQFFLNHVDVIQIGARNMQNFDLLKAVGQTQIPILLKRGMANTIQEWLCAAEYIMSYGNFNVILCERGIRTFETETRNTLDLTVIPILRSLTHLPIIIDPSHACGNRDYVEPVSLAAIAAGADGLMIEVHNQPDQALSDGKQSLTIEQFESLFKKSKAVANAIGRSIL